MESEVRATTLQPGFVTPGSTAMPDASKLDAEALTALANTDFDALTDTLRSMAAEEGAIERLKEITASLPTESSGTDNLRAALLEVTAALSLERDDKMEAALAIAEALGILARQPRRKDYPFLVVLGSLLFDLTLLHEADGQFKHAERSIEKALKVIQRLVRLKPSRYAPTQMIALEKATKIYRDRVAQTELLVRYQADTSESMRQFDEQASAEAARRLARSLEAEGSTLTRMGRHREAMQYFSRALKYLTKIETAFSLEQLRLSIKLGESMLHVGTMRDKGVHLLNTMLHKATRLGAAEEHRRIVDALYHSKSRTFDIIAVWHKIFPT